MWAEVEAASIAARSENKALLERTLDFCFVPGQSLRAQMNSFAGEAAALSPQQQHVALQMGCVCQYGPKCEVWNDFPSVFRDTKVSWGRTGYRVKKKNPVNFVRQSLLSEERWSFCFWLRRIAKPRFWAEAGPSAPPSTSACIPGARLCADRKKKKNFSNPWQVKIDSPRPGLVQWG